MVKGILALVFDLPRYYHVKHLCKVYQNLFINTGSGVMTKFFLKIATVTLTLDTTLNFKIHDILTLNIKFCVKLYQNQTINEGAKSIFKVCKKGSDLDLGHTELKLRLV